MPIKITMAYDAWFREKVREAMADIGSAIPNDEVEARFAKRRAAALRKAEGRKS